MHPCASSARAIVWVPRYVGSDGRGRASRGEIRYDGTGGLLSRLEHINSLGQEVGRCLWFLVLLVLLLIMGGLTTLLLALGPMFANSSLNELLDLRGNAVPR